MCRGIVLCVVGVNICIPDVNRDVIAGGCQAVFICGLSSRSNFDGAVLRSFYFSVDQTGTRKQNGEQENQRSHGKLQRDRSKVPLQRQNRPTQVPTMRQPPDDGRAFKAHAHISYTRAGCNQLNPPKFDYLAIGPPRERPPVLATQTVFSSRARLYSSRL